jgi:hypothetical protein
VSPVVNEQGMSEWTVTEICSSLVPCYHPDQLESRQNGRGS